MSLDPTVYEFCALTASEAHATEFARQHRLLLSNVDLGRQQVRNGLCMMGTANCTGIAHAGHRSARGKIYQGFHCPKCKKFRSAKNAFIDGELREVPNRLISLVDVLIKMTFLCLSISLSLSLSICLLPLAAGIAIAHTTRQLF